MPYVHKRVAVSRVQVSLCDPLPDNITKACDVSSQPTGDYFRKGGLAAAGVTGQADKHLLRQRFHGQILRTAVGRASERVLFKAAGGPVTAVAVVTGAPFIDLSRTPIEEIRSGFQEALGATDDAFWAARSGSRWVSLLALGNVHAVVPVSIAKRDRRRWVRYPSECRMCDKSTLSPGSSI